MKENLVLFGVTFVVVFLFYFFLVVLRYRKGYQKDKCPVEVRYLVNCYHIDPVKLPYLRLLLLLSGMNALLIAVAIAVATLVKGNLLQLVVGFVTLLPLVLLSYHILGKYYQKKERKQHV